MEKTPSLLSTYDKHNNTKSATGKAVFEAANYHSILRNKIRTGIANTVPLSSDSPAQTINQAVPSAFPTAVSSHPTFSSSTLPTPLCLNKATLHLDPLPEVKGSTGVVEDILAPLSADRQTLVKEKGVYSTISLAFTFNGCYHVLPTPQNISVLELRDALIQKRLFPLLTDLSGWRLSYGDQLLLDDSLLASFSLPSGAVLSVVPLPNDGPISLPPREYNAFNAATYNPRLRPNEIFVRTIERSRCATPTAVAPLSQSQPPVEPTSKEPVSIPVHRWEFPELRREGYYMRPDHYVMRDMEEAELAAVREFTVGHEGDGEVCWEGETDVRGLNLDERVVIGRDLNGVPFVHVYPPEVYLNVLPPEGTELNKRARISLFNMFPRGLRGDVGAMRFAERLRKQVEASGGEWVDYDIHRGVLQFIVNHFWRVCSIYGVSLESNRQESSSFGTGSFLKAGMKRGYGTALATPVHSSGTNGQLMGNGSSREFLTTIPHPIPRGMRLRAPSTQLLKATPARSEMALRGSLCDSTSEAYSPEDDAWKRLRSQCPHWMEKAKGQDNSAGSGRGDVSGRLAVRSVAVERESKSDVKRIWPVMGFGKLEIREEETAFIVNLDIPGVSKNTIDVSLRPTSILVECVRAPIPVVKNRFRYIERPSGKLVRTIQLPTKANPDAIRCTYVDGVLSFSIEKLSDQEVTRKVNVE